MLDVNVGEENLSWATQHLVVGRELQPRHVLVSQLQVDSNDLHFLPECVAFVEALGRACDARYHVEIA